MRGAIWIAIGALVLAALVCVVWVLIGPQNAIIVRAFFTILLLAAFAGITLLDTSLSQHRPGWVVLMSMITWVLAFLVGVVKIWIDDGGLGLLRFIELLAVIGLLQLALLHQRLYWPAHTRYVTGFTRSIAAVTTAFLAALVGMLMFFLAFPRSFDYVEMYWRIVVAITIVVAVGTTLIPLLNALFAPRTKPTPPPVFAQQAAWSDQQAWQGQQPWSDQQAWPDQQAVPPQQVAPSQQVAPPQYPMTTQPAWPAQQATAGEQPMSDRQAAGPAQAAAPEQATPPQQPLLPWPYYTDGVTPLPMLPDGSPDWNAYYTGTPSPGSVAPPGYVPLQ